jgi:hypothetical protein
MLFAIARLSRQQARITPCSQPVLPRHNLWNYSKCPDNRNLAPCFCFPPCAIENGVRGHQRDALVFAVINSRTRANALAECDLAISLSSGGGFVDRPDWPTCANSDTASRHLISIDLFLMRVQPALPNMMIARDCGVARSKSVNNGG